MYRSLFSRDVFAELDRMQQDMQRMLGWDASIRGVSRGGFPALNVGSAPQSVEVFVFAPGIDPSTIDVNLDRGVLTISAERKSDLPQESPQLSLHIHERFDGRFRRVLSLPDDVDPDRVDAQYRDGVLHVSVKRRESALPRRIEVQ